MAGRLQTKRCLDSPFLRITRGLGGPDGIARWLWTARWLDGPLVADDQMVERSAGCVHVWPDGRLAGLFS